MVCDIPSSRVNTEYEISDCESLHKHKEIFLSNGYDTI